MFTIREHHLEAIQKNARAEFVAKTIVFLHDNLPEWCSGKSREEICVYIESIINFAQSCSIDEAIAIQKLVYYSIELGCPLPPESTYHYWLLRRPEFDDSYKVDQFVREFTNGVDLTIVKRVDMG